MKGRRWEGLLLIKWEATGYLGISRFVEREAVGRFGCRVDVGSEWYYESGVLTLVDLEFDIEGFGERGLRTFLSEWGKSGIVRCRLLGYIDRTLACIFYASHYHE